MGTWGTAIYSNDTAEDVRDVCKEIFSYYDVDEGNRRLMEEFQETVQQDWMDNDLASFWYALADWQWKHGILTDEIRNKALALLEDYAGLDEWEESNSPKDVVKRKAVLDRLKAQLLTEQPPKKLPKLTLKKPRHKPGDIVIFKTCSQEEDEWDGLWRIRCLSLPFPFQNPKLFNSPHENIAGIDAHSKYMALLCVGSVKEEHSQYIPGLFDEHSIYVWYDHMSDDLPTTQELARCGFLPYVSLGYEDFNQHIYNRAEWVYRFTIEYTFHQVRPNTCISYAEKRHCQEEFHRFEQLFSQKAYSADYVSFFDNFSAYDAMWQEKERCRIAGVPIDNLLDPEACNPVLRTPAEITQSFKEWRWK